MQIKRRHPVVQAGFTLIELMIVVVIILILAGVAYYGYRKWIDKSKTTEADLNLKAIHQGAKAYYIDQRTVSGSLQPITHQLPTPTTAKTGLAACCAMGGSLAKCAPSAALWQDPTTAWPKLKFAVDDAAYFAYGYTTDSPEPTTTGAGTVITNSFQAQAFGDLDCDGDGVEYDMEGIVGADGIQSAGAVIEVDTID